MSRIPHTSPSGKAQCLHYHNHSRCGRIARYEISFTARGHVYHQSVCARCLEEAKEQYPDTRVIQYSEKGFTVETPQFGPVARYYHPIP